MIALILAFLSIINVKAYYFLRIRDWNIIFVRTVALHTPVSWGSLISSINFIYDLQARLLFSFDAELYSTGHNSGYRQSILIPLLLPVHKNTIFIIHLLILSSMISSSLLLPLLLVSYLSFLIYFHPSSLPSVLPFFLPSILPFSFLPSLTHLLYFLFSHFFNESAPILSFKQFKFISPLILRSSSSPPFFEWCTSTFFCC